MCFKMLKLKAILKQKSKLTFFLKKRQKIAKRPNELKKSRIFAVRLSNGSSEWIAGWSSW